MELKKGLLYLSLHNQLFRKYGDIVITRKELFCKLGKHFQVPKNLRYIVVKELEERNFIKIKDRDHIQILPLEIDIEKEVNKLYSLAGLT